MFTATFLIFFMSHCTFYIDINFSLVQTQMKLVLGISPLLVIKVDEWHRVCHALPAYPVQTFDGKTAIELQGKPDEAVHKEVAGIGLS